MGSEGILLVSSPILMITMIYKLIFTMLALTEVLNIHNYQIKIWYEVFATLFIVGGSDLT